MNIYEFCSKIGGNFDHTKMPLELFTKLDRLATLLGCNEKNKLHISSHFRTPKQNLKCGGSPTSSHLNGSAVDILCPTLHHKYYIVENAIRVGFKRIGIYDRHIHLDVDLHKPQCVIWLGKSK